MATQTVPVSAIVCVRNRERVIGRCLKSLRAARAAEIIVVDGRSSDHTVQVAQAFGVRIISDGGRGLGAARQLGAEVATEDHVFFVDSDTVVRRDTAEILLREATENGFDAVQAQLVTGSTEPSYWQAGERWRRLVQERPGIAAALGCQATLVRRSVVLDVGFDPIFDGAAEDGDFFFRARRGGARLARSRAAAAYHQDRRRFVGFARQRFWHGRGLAKMLVRHGRRYTSGAADQGSSAIAGIHIRYLPFLAVSTFFLATGMIAESARILLGPRLRVELRQPVESSRGPSSVR